MEAKLCIHFQWQVCLQKVFSFIFGASKGFIDNIHSHLKVHKFQFVPFDDKRCQDRTVDRATPKYVSDLVAFIRNFALQEGYANPSGAGLPFINKISGCLEMPPADGVVFLHSETEKKEIFKQIKSVHSESPHKFKTENSQVLHFSFLSNLAIVLPPHQSL